MSKKITRAELEAIGQNWLNRRNKLIEYAKRPESPFFKSIKAWVLAERLNQRIAKIIVILGQSNPPKYFASGGFVRAESVETMQHGEYVITRPNFKK